MPVHEPPCEQEFQLPDTVVPVSRSEEAVRYLKRVNAYDAYLAGRVDIRYDFRMNRVVYLIKDGRRTVDAAGRSLVNAKPKWWRYGKSGNPFVCGSGRTGIIVEDCASACSLSSMFAGLALLGTNLQDSHLPTLRRYDRLLVALDKDATKKALELVRRLQAIRPTNLIVLNKDVKDMTNDERHSTFEKYIN
jgi:DNA primase